MQLNRREAGLHLRKSSPEIGDLVSLLEKWARHGVTCGVVTDGPNPALVRIHGRTYRVTPPRIAAINPVGSGDCLLAGLVNGTLNGFDSDALIRHAFGCALSNALVWDAGAVDNEEVARQGRKL